MLSPLRLLQYSQRAMSRAMATCFQHVLFTSGCGHNLKRVRLLCTSSASGASRAGSGRKKVVFLGSPSFAADSLKKIHAAGKDLGFDVPLVVTQPPQIAGRKRVLTPTPVHVAADELNIDVLHPAKASEPEFLETLEAMEPDLCVTAAYGNFLPTKFLRIPRCGTVNIHPSLLPEYRGAAPVPRALEAGVPKTGVTLMFTVLEMDAGPIIAQYERILRGDEKAPALLEELFDEGTQLLLNQMPAILDGSVKSTPQDSAKASHASKMSKQEGTTFFTENAVRVHNKVRAFAGWPGVWTELESETEKGEKQELRVKVLTTRVHQAEGAAALGVHDVNLDAIKDAVRIVCDDGSVLDLLEVQVPGGKPMSAKEFKQTQQGKRLSRKRVPH